MTAELIVAPAAVQVEDDLELLVELVELFHLHLELADLLGEGQELDLLVQGLLLETGYVGQRLLELDVVLAEVKSSPNSGRQADGHGRDQPDPEPDPTDLMSIRRDKEKGVTFAEQKRPFNNDDWLFLPQDDDVVNWVVGIW